MLHQNLNHPGCSESPEKILHVPIQSDRLQFRAIFPLRAESHIAEPNVTSQQSDDNYDDAQRIVTPPSHHRHPQPLDIQRLTTR